jgi:hypothetical protein
MDDTNKQINVFRSSFQLQEKKLLLNLDENHQRPEDERQE